MVIHCYNNNEILLIGIENEMWMLLVFCTETLILKRYANRVIFLKILLANYDCLCDLNGFGFYPWENNLEMVLDW